MAFFLIQTLCQYGFILSAVSTYMQNSKALHRKTNSNALGCALLDRLFTISARFSAVRCRHLVSKWSKRASKSSASKPPQNPEKKP